MRTISFINNPAVPTDRPTAPQCRLALARTVIRSRHYWGYAEVAYSPSQKHAPYFSPLDDCMIFSTVQFAHGQQLPFLFYYGAARQCLYCCQPDQPSQWRMAKLGVGQAYQSTLKPINRLIHNLVGDYLLIKRTLCHNASQNPKYT